MARAPGKYSTFGLTGALIGPILHTNSANHSQSQVFDEAAYVDVYYLLVSVFARQ